MARRAPGYVSGRRRVRASGAYLGEVPKSPLARGKNVQIVRVCLAVVVLSACNKSESKEPPKPKVVEQPVEQAPPPKDPQEVATERLMRGHYEKAVEAREALIRADVPAAKAAMKWLAQEQEAFAVLPELRPLLAEMRRAAAEFDKADTLRAAGDALAATLTRCGSCHSAAGKGPTVAISPVPDGDDARAHMQRHHWAAQRMWEGLVLASPERFGEAASVLAEASLSGRELGPAELSAKDVARLDAHVHKLGEDARAATTDEARAEVYGRLLATCATCHKLMKRGPQPVE